VFPAEGISSRPLPYLSSLMSSYDLHSHSSNRPWQAHIDMYRKLPVDLMEGSRRGSILSYLSLTLMTVLLLLETRAFLQTTMVTDLALDKSNDPKIRFNFNITMTDLRCDWAVIDVVRWVCCMVEVLWCGNVNMTSYANITKKLMTNDRLCCIPSSFSHFSVLG
jgi:hypothetical protein